MQFNSSGHADNPSNVNPGGDQGIQHSQPPVHNPPSIHGTQPNLQPSTPATPIQPQTQDVPSVTQPQALPGQDPNNQQFTQQPRDDYQQRYNNAQKHITNLEQENKLSLQTIEAKTAQIEQNKQEMGNLARQINQLAENVKNVKIDPQERQLQYNMMRDLKQDYDKLNNEVTNTEQQAYQYEQELAQAHYMKQQTHMQELETLVNDPELLQIYGSPQNIYNAYQTHVIPASQQNRALTENYLFNRMNIRQVFDQVMAPQQNFYNNLYAKQTNSFGNGAANPAVQAPQAPVKENKMLGGIFSI